MKRTPLMGLAFIMAATLRLAGGGGAQLNALSDAEKAAGWKLLFNGQVSFRNIKIRSIEKKK